MYFIFFSISGEDIFFFFFPFIFISWRLITLQYWFLPYIDMNQSWICMCSPSWTPLPPPSPFHPSGDTDAQNRLLDSMGEGEGGMIWENSIKTCILSSVKQIASPGFKKIRRKYFRYKNGMKNDWGRDFCGCAMDKNPLASAGNLGSIPGPGISHILRGN